MRLNFNIESARYKKPTLRFKTNSSSDTLSNNVFVGGYSQLIADWCAEQIVSVEPDNTTGLESTGADYVLNHKVEETPNEVNSSFSMMRSQDDSILWQHVSRFDQNSENFHYDIGLNRAINHRVDWTLFEIAPTADHSTELNYLRHSTLGAVRLIYRNRGADMSIARRMLSEMQKASGRGLHFAWLAYSLCFDKAESNVQTHVLQEEAETLCQWALELEPFNSMTLALVSYTTTLLLNNPIAGLELSKRSIELNRANPLAWSFQSAALYSLKKFEEAYASA